MKVSVKCFVTVHEGVLLSDLQLDAAISSSVNAPEVKGIKSFEEREEEYEKARARIFNQLPPSGIQTSRNTIAFDLATRTTQRTSRYSQDDIAIELSSLVCQSGKKNVF